MHVAQPDRVGSIAETREVVFNNIKTLIEVRKTCDTYTIFVVDEIPEDIIRLDVEYVHDLILAKGLPPRRALEVAARELGINSSPELLNAVWTRWREYYGALTPLLLLDDLTDLYLYCDRICAQHMRYGLCEVRLDFPPQEIIVRKLFRKYTRRLEFSCEKLVRYVIRRVSERTRSPVTAYMPMLSVTDRELRARFSLSIEPVSEPYVHIRLLPRVPWTLTRLVQHEMLSLEQAAVLWTLFDLKVPILVIGPMGSGKTSLANAITFNSDPSVLKAVIMDVDEMFLPGHNVLKLLERRSYGLGIKPITKSELIAHALRVGADYIIVNEVRTRDEVKAWIDAVTTGHGGVTTFHADDLTTLRIRLENMLERPCNIEREVAVVKVGLVHTVYTTPDGVRVRKPVRKVLKIHIPDHVRISREEVELRARVLAQMLNLTIEQQVAMLSQFYREPDRVLSQW